MRIQLLQLCTMLLFSSALVAQKDVLRLIPQPESITMGKGSFQFSGSTKIIVPRQFMRDLAPYIIEKIKNDVGLTVDVQSGNSGSINSVQFKKTNDRTIAQEGYVLEVSPNNILIKAKNYVGMFYGFQTLRQLMPITAASAFDIPCVSIKDQPRFGWRGLMIDVSRHFQTKEFIMKQIDIASAYKINTFHWHLTDDQGWRIEIKKYPELTKKGAWRADRTGIAWWDRELATAQEPKTIGGFYTQEDIKKVIAYAKLRNVTVVPEIDVPGHSKALVASYPHLSCLDDTTFEVAVGGKAPDNALCAGKETTYTFLADVIAEVAALFPSKYIHIGGDECNKKNWKSCPHCQKVKKENRLEDEEELQSHFMGRMNDIITSNKKTMIGWDEILSGKGAKGATIMAWRRNKYQPQIDAPRNGYPTIMTSYVHSYLSQIQGPTVMEPEGPRVVLPLSKVYGHEPVSKELTAEEAKLVLGTEACLWAEFTPTPSHAEYMLYPRALASAEVAWSSPWVKDWQRFQATLPTHFQRLQRDGVNYSTSMYSVYPSYAIDELEYKAKVYLNTELEGYDIRYTLDEKDPTAESEKYEGVFTAKPRTLLKAGLFDKNGKLMGAITELRLR